MGKSCLGLQTAESAGTTKLWTASDRHQQAWTFHHYSVHLELFPFELEGRRRKAQRNDKSPAKTQTESKVLIFTPTLCLLLFNSFSYTFHKKTPILKPTSPSRNILTRCVPLWKSAPGVVWTCITSIVMPYLVCSYINSALQTGSDPLDVIIRLVWLEWVGGSSWP